MHVERELASQRIRNTGRDEVLAGSHALIEALLRAEGAGVTGDGHSDGRFLSADEVISGDDLFCRYTEPFSGFVVIHVLRS